VEHVVSDMSAAPAEVAVEMIVHSVTNDDAILAALPQLQAPVVAINPDYRPNDIEALRRHGVEVVLMPGVGHFLMLEDPHTFNRLLGETVEEFR
jgi:pimeloyl-ACP methyl ester carboxylesterase